MVVVSHDGFNSAENWRSIIVVPLTTSTRQQLRGPTVVGLPPEETGLAKVSFALGHQITTLDRQKLEAAVGTLTHEHLQAVGRAIAAACDLTD